MFKIGITLAAALALAPVTHNPAGAQEEGSFYQGRTVTVIVPSGAGGSYHLYCEIVSRHLGKHLPNNPTVIIQNRPGAGGAVAAAYMMNVAPKDGTMLAMISPGSITDPLIRPQRYDATKFNWLGSVATRAQLIAVWHEAPAKTIEDLRRVQTTMAATGRSDAGFVVPSVINAVLGTNMKIILGYGSGGEMNQALERGEVHGRGNYYSGFASVRPDWIRDKKIRFLTGIGPAVPELPDLPNVRQFVKPDTLEAKMLDLVELNFNVGQAFYAPPDLAAKRIDTMREAFGAMLADPALREDYRKRNLDFQPLSGEAIESKIEEAFKSANPEVVKRLRQVLTAEK
ncbi:MAG: hypothetical protein GEU92_07010 [Alphaproteobacteria bacterium]|nr:hypothetical protein [Alphaproteobacteria bacterium]